MQPVDAMNSLTEIRDYLRHFAKERDWEQFHSPKNLVMALSVEVAELMEHFQWLTEAQAEQLPPDVRAAVAHEIADVQLYLIRLADRLQVDLPGAIQTKTAINEARYPADKVRGSSRKYSDY